MSKKINIKRIIVILIVFAVIFGVFMDFVYRQENESVATTSNSKVRCLREEPYKLAPEFERARSLRNQRKSEAGLKLDYSWYNCINVVYKDLPDADGMFYFDKNSSTQNLTVYVDTGYKASDDLLTSILLEHEFAHVGQFVHQIETGKETPCFDSEA